MRPAPRPPAQPDAAAAILAATVAVGLDVVIVSRFEFRDRDGQHLHTEQREDRVTGPDPEARQAAAAAVLQGAADLRQEFLRRAAVAADEAAALERDTDEAGRALVEGTA